jgi:hypothetical protein
MGLAQRGVDQHFTPGTRLDCAVREARASVIDALCDQRVEKRAVASLRRDSR